MDRQVFNDPVGWGLPKTKLGKWSVGLQVFFVAAIVVSLILVKLFNVLNFDNTWWDITVGVVFPASIMAFITGIIDIIKNKDRSALVYLCIFIGVCVVLFIPLHSLFIND